MEVRAEPAGSAALVRLHRCALTQQPCIPWQRQALLFPCPAPPALHGAHDLQHRGRLAGAGDAAHVQALAAVCTAREGRQRAAPGWPEAPGSW